MTQLIIILGYLIVLLGVGLLSNRALRGTTKDYLLASHSIGPFLLLMSLFGTTMTGFSIVGSTGESFKVGVGVYGMLASSSAIVHSLCFFVLGIKLWSVGKRHGYLTQIQFFRDRLESRNIGLLLFPVLVGLVVTYLLIGVLAAGIVVNGLTEGAFATLFAEYDYGVPPWLGSLSVCVVVLLYVFFGGMRGTVWANTFQTVVFMVFGVVTFVVITDKLGGFENSSRLVAERNPTKLKREVDPADQQRFDASYGQWELLAEYNFVADDRAEPILSDEQKQLAHEEFKPRPPGWQTIAEAVFASQHGMLDALAVADRNRARLVQDDRAIPDPLPDNWETTVLDSVAVNSHRRIPGSDVAGAIRLYSSKIGHPKEALDPDNVDAGHKWSRKRAAGVYRATHWSPEVPHGMDPLIFLTYLLVPLSVGMFPHIFQHWLTARSANSFKLAVVAHPIFITIVWAPAVMIGVWATSAMIDGHTLFPPHFSPNAVIAVMVQRLTSPVLAGFLGAGILAAIMSSLDSQFLCVGSMFTNDVVVHYAGEKRFNEQQQIVIARVFIVAIVALTYGLSLFEPRRVFTLGVWCFSGFSALVPLVFASLYWRRLTKAGAYASIVATTASWLYFFCQSNYAANPNYTFLGMMPVASMIVCSSVALVVVSLATKPPSSDTLAKFFPTK